MMNRESFVFYRSFQDAINEANEKEQLLIYRAIANYALNREEPQLVGMAKIAWVLIKPQLDANWRRYENGCKGAEYGKKGGAPRGNNNAVKQNNPKTTPNQPQNKGYAVEKTTPNVNDNVNDNDNNNVNNNSKDMGKAETAKRFTPPTIEQVQIYISEKGYSVDAEKFVAFYQSKNWMVGKNKMKDWRAAILTWEKSDKQTSRSYSKKQSNVNDIWD